jgi:hypothetical protein
VKTGGRLRQHAYEENPKQEESLTALIRHPGDGTSLFSDCSANTIDDGRERVLHQSLIALGTGCRS